jgi:predicted DNA-binding transcriptional regulator YafY
MIKIKNFDEFDKLQEAADQNQEEIKRAILNKLVCIIDYRDSGNHVDDGIRTIEPYRIGINRQGNTVLRAWMKTGTSKTGKVNPDLVPGWRLYRIDRIYNIDIIADTFTTPRKGYGDDDKKMDQVLVSAKF